MKSGKLGISAAYELSKLTPDQQKDFYEQHMDDDEITLKSIEDFIHPAPEETGVSRILCKFLRNLCRIFPSEGQAVHQ